MKKSIAKQYFESAEKSADIICGERYEPHLDFHAVAILGAAFGRSATEYLATLSEEDQTESLGELMRTITEQIVLRLKRYANT